MLCRIAVKLHVLVVQALIVVVAFHRGDISSHGALYEVDVLLFLMVVVSTISNYGVEPLQVGFNIKIRILCNRTNRCEERQYEDE